MSDVWIFPCLLLDLGLWLGLPTSMRYHLMSPVDVWSTPPYPLSVSVSSSRTFFEDHSESHFESMSKGYLRSCQIHSRYITTPYLRTFTQRPCDRSMVRDNDSSQGHYSLFGKSKEPLSVHTDQACSPEMLQENRGKGWVVRLTNECFCLCQIESLSVRFRDCFSTPLRIADRMPTWGDRERSVCLAQPQCSATAKYIVPVQLIMRI